MDAPPIQTPAIEILGSPITLPCGLVLPNRTVKAPMQETLATLPFYAPPMEKFRQLYDTWSKAEFGLIITGQVQIDIRFLSRPGDTVVRAESLEPENLALWKEWATLAQSKGTPCIVQLAHPGRMSAKGSGLRPIEMQSMCPSSVPVDMGGSAGNKKSVAKIMGIPREMTMEDIDEVVGMFKIGAEVAHKAGFSGIQLHAAHGFLLSQFLSPYTNRRNDDYGGTPEKRMTLLKRLVTEIREACPPPFCVSVKLNSGDYMKEGGLTTDEALEQVRWLITCGMIDMVEISGGNAEGASQGQARLHRSFGWKSINAAPVRKESTRIREALFTDFAERVQAIGSSVPITLSGGFRSRVGMADAIESGVCDLVGLGRAVVIQPSLPREILLNPNVPDEEAFAMSHQIQGLWLAAYLPVSIVGMGLPLRFFYHNMKRLGAGLQSDPHVGLPYIFITGTLQGMLDTLGLFASYFFGSKKY